MALKSRRTPGVKLRNQESSGRLSQEVYSSRFTSAGESGGGTMSIRYLTPAVAVKTAQSTSPALWKVCSWDVPSVGMERARAQVSSGSKGSPPLLGGRVGVMVCVCVAVGVNTGVPVAVGVSVAVGVGVDVAVGEWVAAGVAVTVGVSVAVGVDVAVGEWMAVRVAVGVGVQVAVGVAVASPVKRRMTNPPS